MHLHAQVGPGLIGQFDFLRCFVHVLLDFHFSFLAPRFLIEVATEITNYEPYFVAQDTFHVDYVAEI